MTDNNYIGNGSTIIKFIALTIAGWTLSTLAAKGYDLGIDVTTLASVIGAFIGLIIAYIDAKYPNTFRWLNNAEPETLPDDEPLILNEEYEFGDDKDGC